MFVKRVLRTFLRNLPIWRLTAAKEVEFDRREEADCLRGAVERAVVDFPLVDVRRRAVGRLRVVWVYLRGIKK
jgi:hypothetical protein